MNKLPQVYQVWKTGGARYLFFRTKYEGRHNGKLQKQFPVTAEALSFTALEDWRKA